MNRILLSAIASILLAIAGSFSLFASPLEASPRPGRGLRLTDEQIRTIEAVTGPISRSKSNVRTNAPRLAPIKFGKRNAPARVNPSGSSIQGWRTVPELSASSDINGWYELSLDGSQQFRWSYTNPDTGESNLPFVCGVYRNGRVYGFNSQFFFTWLFIGRGSFDLEGNIYDYTEYDSSDDLSQYIISIAYDSLTDTGYAYTLNEDGSAYMFRSLDFDTWTFNTLNDNVIIEDVCPGFAYNPVDGLLYGVTTDGRFVSISKENGELTTVSNTGLPVTTHLCGFTYSPLDKKFVLVHTTGDDSSTLVTIDPVDGTMSSPIELENTVQYRILITPNVVIDPKAPKAPAITSDTFANGSVSGNFTLTLPTQTFDDNPISSLVTLIAYLDNTEYSRTSGQPGDAVTVFFPNIAEGNHSFCFVAELDGKKSASVEKSMYIGYDTPKAPQNVVLGEGTLSWDAVTEGINGGYIDLDNISYNAYLDGVKLNTEPITATSYTFTAPAGNYTIHAAQIEAVNHSHVSDRTLSNNFAYGDPLPLPAFFAPTDIEKQLFTVLHTKHPMRSWRYTTNYDGEKCFWCYTTDYDPVDEPELLILPPVYVPQTDNLLEISFDVKGGLCEYSRTLENFSVFIGDAPQREALAPVKTFPDFVSTEWSTVKVYTKATQGKRYIAIGTFTSEDSDEISVRNMRVSVSDKPSNTPAAVTALTATAAPEGALKATVEFDLPVISLSGSSLEGTQISATVVCGSQTKNVSGTAGSHQSVEVTTLQGPNTITVTPANVAEGEPASVSVYTGLDIPSPISVMKVSHTQDFSGLVFNWEAPTTGINGGYIVPEEVTYSYCLYNDETYEWEIAGELGTSTNYTYTQQVPDTLVYSQIGFLSSNSAGNAGTIRVDAGMAGNPLQLPLIEDFDIFEGIYADYYYLERPDKSYTDYFGYIGGAYPYHIDVPTPRGGESAFVAANVNGDPELKARVALPVFSTVGEKNVALEIPFYCAPNSAECKVFAQIYGTEPREIGSFVDNSFTGWKKMRFYLPDDMLNQQWVILTVETYMTDTQTIGAFADYKVREVPDNDLAVTAAQAPVFGSLSQTVTVTAEVENQGRSTHTMPQVVCEMERDGKFIASLPMKAEGQAIEDMSSTLFSASFTPTADMAGEIKYTFRIVDNDDILDNNVRTAEGSLSAFDTEVVTDLSADKEDEGVRLTWTAPSVGSGEESFESLPPYYYGEEMCGFKNIVRDEYESAHFIEELRFPFDNANKAWQAVNADIMQELFDNAGYQNTYFNPLSGKQLLFTTVPYSIYVGEDLTADRWLISPEVEPGSVFKFNISSFEDGRIEDIEVLYSTTDDDPDSFTKLEDITLISARWREFEYTLPEDAKYFAIRYRGNTEKAFGVVLDDITYEPGAGRRVIEGYDIFRNGSLVAENAQAVSEYIDPVQGADNTTYYNIRPVVKHLSLLERGMLSNTAFVGMSSVEDILLGTTRVYGSRGSIMLQGFDSETVDICSVDGLKIATVTTGNADTVTSVPVAAGIYIVRTADATYKVIVF